MVISGGLRTPRAGPRGVRAHRRRRGGPGPGLAGQPVAVLPAAGRARVRAHAGRDPGRARMGHRRAPPSTSAPSARPATCASSTRGTSSASAATRRSRTLCSAPSRLTPPAQTAPRVPAGSATPADSDRSPVAAARPLGMCRSAAAEVRGRWVSGLPTGGGRCLHSCAHAARHVDSRRTRRVSLGPEHRSDRYAKGRHPYTGRARKSQGGLDHLSTTRRREIAARIKEAREFGDISENAEYDDAKNEQAMLEARIASLEDKLRSATVVDASDLGTDIVRVGSSRYGSGVHWQLSGTSTLEEGKCPAPAIAATALGAVLVTACFRATRACAYTTRCPGCPGGSGCA